MEVLKEMLGPLSLIVIMQLTVFAVVAIILRKILLSDTMSAVARMKAAEGELAKKEEAMLKKMEAHDQDFSARKAEAEAELQKHRDTAEQDLSRLRERITAEAKVQADKIVSEAQLGKEKVREQLMREMDEKAVDFAGELFKLVVSKEVGDKLNVAFIDELIGALEEVDEGSVHVDAADEVSFVSSHPLGDEQKNKLQDVISRKFGAEVKIEEKVDAGILAGLVIKIGSLEIDGSLLNRYREGVGEMKRAM